MNCLVFDIETIPDVALGRRLYNLEGLSDEQVAKAMFALRRQATGSEFLPNEQQRIVAISCVLRSRDGLELNKAFVRISDVKARRAIVDLVRSLANDDTKDPPVP